MGFSVTRAYNKNAAPIRRLGIALTQTLTLTAISRPRYDACFWLRFGRREVATPIEPSREVSTFSDGFAPGLVLGLGSGSVLVLVLGLGLGLGLV